MEAIKEFFKPVIDDFNLIKGKFLSYPAEIRKVMGLTALAYFSLVIAMINFGNPGFGFLLFIIVSIISQMMGRNQYVQILKDGGQKISIIRIPLKYYLTFYMAILSLAILAKILILAPGFIAYVIMLALIIPLAALMYKKEKDRKDLD